MDQPTLIATVTSVVAAKACIVSTVWLRQHRRVRQDEARRMNLADVAERLPAGSRMELHEQWDDGHCVRMQITRDAPRRNGAAA